jgi:hypothetical protein
MNDTCNKNDDEGLARRRKQGGTMFAWVKDERFGEALPPVDEATRDGDRR